MKKRNFIYFLLTLLPILDLITSLQTRADPYGFSVGMFIKGLAVILAIVYLLFFSTSKYKTISFLYLGLIGIFGICYFGFKPELINFSYLITELKYLFRIIYMPILFVFFLNYFDEVGFDKKLFIKSMMITLIEFTILLLVPLLLNVAYESYSTGLHGYVGWYYAANEISVIMIVLLPFIYYFLNSKSRYNFFIALPILYAIASIGTKVTFIGAIMITVLGFVFKLVEHKCKINNHTVGSFFILVFTIFFFCFANDIAISNVITLAEREDFTFVQTPTLDSSNMLTGTLGGDYTGDDLDLDIDSSRDDKEEEKEADSFFTRLTKFLLSSRDIYYLQTKDIYEKTYRSSYTFVGMGFSNTQKINNINIDKLIEIDYLDLYYHTGVFGLVIVLLPYLYVAYRILVRLFERHLTRGDICFIFYNSLVVCMALSIAAVAGHVLYYPAVSIYLALYLIYLLYGIGKFRKKEINENKVDILALHLDYGGIENVICNQASMLANKYKVEIVCLYDSHKTIPFKLDKRVKVTYLLDTTSNRQEVMDALKHFKLITLFKEVIKALRIIYLKHLMIKEAILNSDAKVIISTRKEFSELLGRYHRDEVVAISEEHNHHKNSRKIIRSVKKSNKHVDYLLPTSKELTDFYALKVKAKVKYIPNVLNYYPEKINKLNTKKILAIGRLAKEKGFIDLIPVMKEVLKTNKEVILDIYGDGKEKEALLKAIKNNNLQKHVKLQGFVSPNQLRSKMTEYSLFLCPSYEESFGLAVLEAMSFGIPCIMFDDAKGPMEFVDEETGIIIEKRNTTKMAQAITDLLASPEKLRKLGNKSRERSLIYNFENVQEELINLVGEAIILHKTKDKRVMFISSSGGHLNELTQLESLFAKYNYSLITEKTKTTKGLKKEHPKKCKYLLYGTKHHPISYFLWILPVNCFISLVYYIKYRPKCIITTGAHTAGPMCLIGKIFGSKVVFIESFANIHSKSVTGKIIYKMADLFIVQWEDMRKCYPKAVYGGWIY